MTMNLIQLIHPELGRRIAVVDQNTLTLIDSEFPSNYHLFTRIINHSLTPSEFISGMVTGQKLDYNQIYKGESDWNILPAMDHPESPLYCILSGTGLTHKASAENRQKMHQQLEDDEITDSMEMYLWGEKGGKPEKGTVGIQPEWFYKGNGTSLKAHGETLEIPSYAEDGGEEPEIAGIYLIAEDGSPYKVGYAQANEFSDHVMERKNYLYLAPSKLRQCAIGPELVIYHDFQDVTGNVETRRNDKEIWSETIKTGEKNMCHSVENLEHHHFKYEQHRIPGTVHIHFYGADAFSFGAGLRLKDGDQMEISFDGFGRKLINTLTDNSQEVKLVRVNNINPKLSLEQ
jgi:hypothetical protein